MLTIGMTKIERKGLVAMRHNPGDEPLPTIKDLKDIIPKQRIPINSWMKITRWSHRLKNQLIKRLPRLKVSSAAGANLGSAAAKKTSTKSRRTKKPRRSTTSNTSRWQNRLSKPLNQPSPKLQSKSKTLLSKFSTSRNATNSARCPNNSQPTSTKSMRRT